MKNIVDIPEEYRPDIEELPGDLSRIAAAIEEHLPGLGMQVILIIAQIFPGQPLFIHNVKYLIRRIRDDAIRAEYDTDQTTMLKLAAKFNLGHRRIKQILAQAPSQERLEEKQMRMW